MTKQDIKEDGFTVYWHDILNCFAGAKDSIDYWHRFYVNTAEEAMIQLKARYKPKPLSDEDKVQLWCDICNLITERAGFTGDLAALPCEGLGLIDEGMRITLKEIENATS